MIQDITPQKFNNHYHQVKASPLDIIFLFRQNMLFCKKTREKKLYFPRRREFRTDFRTIYLFSIDRQAYFLAAPDADPALPHGYGFRKVFSLRMSGPTDRRFAAVTAWHLYVWYRDNQFCGRCGKKMTHSANERALCCPACGNLIFPKIAPAVIIGVVHDGKILMSRYRGRDYKGRALIAGFCEIGETAEETVAREVMEEAGVHVKNIHYYKSQPWGFDSNLLLGYFCELDGSDQLRVDPDELTVADWIPREEINEPDDHLSLTREMMLYFKNHKTV